MNVLVLIFLSLQFFIANSQEENEGVADDVIPLITWTEGVSTQDGTTRDYINRAVKLPWRNYLGDWVDSNGDFMGSSPFSTTDLVDDNVEEFVEWTGLESLVQKWVSKSLINNGFFLKGVAGSGSFDFRSRDYSTASQRPELVIKLSDQSDNLVLKASADTYLEPSTYQGQGSNEKMRIGETTPMLVRFDLSSIAKDKVVESATLRLFTFGEYGSTLTVHVYRVALAEYSNPGVKYGLAKDFEDDEDITSHADVLFADKFESDDWGEGWTRGSDSENVEIVEEDAGNHFKSLRNSARAVRARLRAGSNYGISLEYDFQDKHEYEPEEIYFRYYIRLANTWRSAPTDGGKMPGIAGTYGRAGWGGRKVDGTDGWSSRGTFLGPPVPEGNPYYSHVAMGNYVYHTDMEGTYGDVYVWNKDALGFLRTNRWYSVEQYLHLNTPGENNGVMKTWIDGKLAFQTNTMNWRTVDTLKIEQIWMNIYHGGTDKIPSDCWTYIDNVVIAKSYIGPIWPPLSPELAPSEEEEDDNDKRSATKEAMIATAVVVPIVSVAICVFFALAVAVTIVCAFCFGFKRAEKV